MATVAPLRKITQTELGEYVALEATAEKFKKIRKDMIDRHDKGAAVESGELSLQITTEKGTSVSYKGVLDALVKGKATLMAEAEKLIRKFGKPKTSHEVAVTGSTTI